ncbi:hypothetical protein P7D22_12340 [Lichenihabitans sp. Uapishka_5]|uniref:hypothetical protein n=1 Tax=Lichenihabitans sp. Uapishka_5 TaxID=3037302 RepID=UPI0029E801A0|nr:hypothetical protein [Lichenihabitans sp. Uapishka_5]MDX7951959.1 hypothetical protein [Lichenihabitans sp. Uapishka_5]
MPVDRRRILVGLGAALAAGVVPAVAQQSARFAAIRVDAEPLAQRGGSSAATLIAQLMPGKMQDVFGDLLAPHDRGLPVLVARIDTIYMPGYADSRQGPLYGLQQDTLSGAGLVVSGRVVQAETPLHVNLPSSYSGAYYLPDIDQRRIESLCTQFAYWLRRGMQL